MIEIETPEVVVTTTNTDIIVETPSVETEVVDLNDLSITVAKKEYTIVGDGVYIPVLYDDAPQWMKDLVQIVVDASVETGSTAALAELTAMLNEFAVSYVPLNQYTQAIFDLSNEDVNIHGILTTLNSNFDDGLSNANAQIIDLALTKASKTEVVAQVVQTLSAQLADETSNLGAIVGNLEQAIADETSARALSFTTLTASLEDTELGVTANATATQTLNVYVGVDPSGGLTGTGLLADVAILQKQNDGLIETTTGVYDVMINEGSESTAELVVTAEPYATWLAADTTGILVRTSHVGDVYIKYELDVNGAKQYIASYKFIRTVIDSTSPYSTDSEGFTWARVVDTLAESAYIAALNAKDLADGKRRVYVGLGATATPTIPYEVGDLWLIDVARIVNGYSAKVGDILRCVESKTASAATYEANDWVLASSYANAVQAEIDSLESWKNTTYANNISSLQTQLDKKAETFYLNSVPSGRLTLTNVAVNATLDGYVGDLWKNTYVGTVGGYLGNNTEYIYTKSANGVNWDYKWTKMEVPDIVFDTIDTKKTIFTGNTLPVAPKVNDIWIPSANNGSYVKGEIYQYIGGVWGATTRYTADIDALSSNVQAQIDGKVDTYYQNTVPFANATNVSKKVQSGDYWYCTLTAGSYVKGKMYKYVESANGGNWNYVWSETADVTKYAFDLADGKASIFTTSAQPGSYKINDIMIVTTTSFSNGTTTFSNGVVLTSSMNRTAGFVASDWTKKINDTEKLDNFVSSTYTPMVASLKDQIDNKVQSWYTTSTADPRTSAGYWAKYSTNVIPTGAVTGDVWWTTGAVGTYLASKYYVKQSDGSWIDKTTDIRLEHNGDMWYQTNNKKSYWYSNSTNAWNLIEDQTAITALANAADALSAVDDVVVSFYAYGKDTSTSVPTGVGKYWFKKSTRELYSYIDTTWVKYTTMTAGDTVLVAFYDASNVYVDSYTYVYLDSTSGWVTLTANGIVATSESITNLTAYLGTDGGTSTLVNDITSKSNALGKSVDARFLYNSSIVLNGVTYSSGFGLSNSAGTGAGSEFWINADKFKFTNTGKTGSMAPFTIDSSGSTPQISFNGVVNFSNVNGASDNMLSTLGVVNAYSNTNDGTLSFDTAENAIKLYSSTDTGIGCAFKAFPVNNGIGEVFTISVRVKSNVASATGLYIKICEYNADLPAGKTHVSTNAVTSNSVVVEDTSAKTNWHENSSVSTQWTTYTYKYTPTTGAKWASVVVLNWTDLGLNPIWIKDLEIISSIPNVAAAVNSGTTTINGGKIEAVSITAAQIAADSVSADRLKSTTGVSTVWEGGGLVSANFNGNVSGSIGTPTAGFRLSSNAAGTSADPNMYGAYIKGATVEGAVITGSTVSINDLKVKTQSYPANYSPFDLRYRYLNNVGNTTTVISSDLYTAQNSGTGFNTYRMARNAQVFELALNVFGYGDNITSTISVSVNGGAWSDLMTRQQYHSTSLMTTYTHSTSNVNSIQFKATVVTTSGSYDAGVSFEVYSKNA